VAASDGLRLDPDRLIVRLGELEPEARRRPDALRIVRAPGRVNLIGEHTDYNDGFVLPVAIGLETWIACLPTDDRQVRLHLDDGAVASFDLDAIGPRTGTWLDYVAGTAWAMADAGVPTHGFRAFVAATLPREAGLSSSASLELAAAWALSGADAPTLAGMALAQVCQRAENDYVGVQCGLMDQFAVCCGRRGAAMLLDCRSLEHRAVALPEVEVALVVCHTGAQRRLGASAYNQRRDECARSVRQAARERPEVRALRDLDVTDLSWLGAVLDADLLRRSRHVITENARVLEAVAALEAGDVTALGPIFAASHASLRDDYAVSSPELDLLVDIATRTPGVVAARMTGAGFGGCTVNLVRPDAVDGLRDAVLREYPARTGLEPSVMAVSAVDGAGPVR
jgi:galactokinase